MNKIERLGLVEKVEELISSGVTTSAAISKHLCDAGYPISQPTVSRYLKDQREARKKETQNILSDHINKKLPSDLDAVESMEAQCLEWAKEDKQKFAHRLAEKHIQDAAEHWRDLLLASDEKKQKEAIKSIMEQCLLWIADDLKLQTARIAAMKQAGSFVDMKLRYAMGENNDGKIIFLDRSNGDRVEQDDDTGRLMIIRGGQE